ncbi:MAG: dihydroneopterin triphosphate diphosphatase [Gammaproteobacteria bacterium]
MTDRRYKRPVSVLVVVSTRQGEVLMLERLHPGGFWQSVTGSLHRGEKPEVAARRELREETGLEADTLEYAALCNHFPIVEAWRSHYAPSARTNCEYVFRLELENRVAVRLNPGEHLGYKWLPRREAARLASSWTNRVAILALVQPESAPRTLEGWSATPTESNP